MSVTTIQKRKKKAVSTSQNRKHKAVSTTQTKSLTCQSLIDPAVDGMLLITNPGQDSNVVSMYGSVSDDANSNIPAPHCRATSYYKGEMTGPDGQLITASIVDCTVQLKRLEPKSYSGEGVDIASLVAKLAGREVATKKAAKEAAAEVSAQLAAEEVAAKNAANDVATKKATDEAAANHHAETIRALKFVIQAIAIFVLLDLPLIQMILFHPTSITVYLLQYEDGRTKVNMTAESIMLKNSDNISDSRNFSVHTTGLLVSSNLHSFSEEIAIPSVIQDLGKSERENLRTGTVDGVTSWDLRDILQPVKASNVVSVQQGLVLTNSAAPGN